MLQRNKIKLLRWILDSGCMVTHVMRKRFFELDETFNLKVKFENDTIVLIKGRGKIFIKFKDESNKFISNVLYVSGFHQNPLSLGQHL